MTLFIEDGAPVIVQGMTGHQGMTHTARMLKAGTNIVGGVNARKAGLDVTFPEAKNGEDATIHVFANCSEAIEATGAKASRIWSGGTSRFRAASRKSCNCALSLGCPMNPSRI